MGDECEKTCPLCAEEMDLTDRQLKPCKCGYEICVWCWHQIMDLAEKNESEGRCPACRTPYDKDKIVGMAANCGRLVAEVNMEKKHKSQKAKNKTSENRKQLINVRVIQRNLVYIVGLPLNLADEDLLQGKEYFSRYGKVLKVSISRSAAGTIQQFPNDTCSVYITYSKEEEAIRCIQSVHGFILDGRPLRACFGTTKYCHAWLRNAPCNNPDCLYLHEIGSQEDSFTKDEIVSAYTRVQQITGVTNNLQRRSGSVLPSPADDHCNYSCAVIAKPVVKSSNNLTSCTRVPPTNSSSGKSGALPPAASWGARVSNGKPPTVSMASSNGPTKQKADMTQGTPVHATTISGSVPVNHCDVGKKQIQNEEAYGKETKKILENTGTVKEHSGIISMGNVSEGSCTTSGAPVKRSTNDSSCLAASAGDLEGCKQKNNTHVLDGQPHSPCEVNRNCSHLDVQTSSICSDEQQKCEQHSDVIIPNGSSLNCFLQSTSRGLQWQASEKLQEHLSFATATSKTTTAIDGFTSLKETSDVRSDTQSSVTQNITSETEDDFNKQRLQDAIVVNQTTISTSSPLHILNHLRSPPHTDADCAVSYTVYPPSVNRISGEGLATNVSSASVSSNNFLDHFVNRTLDHGSSLLLKGGQENQTGRYNGEPRNFDSQPALDMGENNIISNILSLDLDSWDDSLTSPQNLAKLFCETDKSEGPINLAGSWKGQNSNQSRFSFARQEDSRNHLFDIEPSLGYTGQAVNNSSFGQDFLGNGILYVDKIGDGFGFPHRNIDSDNMISDHCLVPSSKLSRELLTASRSQISAPPGFSAPSRPPPPGFSSQRSDQSIDVSKSGNHLVETSSFFRNTYQASPNGNLNTNFETELFDPAILAVGEGRLPGGLNNSSLDMKSNFPSQISTFENNSRLQALMQRSLLPHLNLRYTNVRDSFSTPNGAYGYTSRHLDGSQVSNHVPLMQCSLRQPRNSVVSNGSLDGWNGLQVTNDVGMKDLPRSDRLGMSNFYGGYEDAKFVMTNTGDLFNRSFKM